jgi:four helix bundle protein
MAETIRHFRELDVYQLAMQMAMEIFGITKSFPVEERYSLSDQVRKSSRSVCANIAEAWRKRRFTNVFTSKLSDAEAEAAETQVSIEMAPRCGYLNPEKSKLLDQQYDRIPGKLVMMINHPDQWTIRSVHEDEANYA